MCSKRITEATLRIILNTLARASVLGSRAFKYTMQAIQKLATKPTGRHSFRVRVRVIKANSRFSAQRNKAFSQLVPLELTSSRDGFQFSSSTHRVKQVVHFIHAMDSQMISTARWSWDREASRIDFTCRPRDARMERLRARAREKMHDRAEFSGGGSDGTRRWEAARE
ncbi:hypothetical protein B0H13DRAFT_1877445 [Mycena leptocephala]|nr:hypothetical protein B0H13DRAFT_1877445 [Mycena leptocephala]